MNQRRGRTHQGAANDRTQKVDLQQLITVVQECQFALEQEGEGDSALRFEIFADYLQHDVADKNNMSLVYTNRMLGL